jgi:type IV pilus assembly protein PilE
LFATARRKASGRYLDIPYSAAHRRPLQGQAIVNKRSVRPLPPCRAGGFTLIELMTVILIIAIIAVIAMNVYGSYIARRKIQAAKSDLSALALNLENQWQANLQYATHNTTRTVDTMNAYKGWAPAEIKDFTFTVASSSSSYVLTATGISGPLATCVLQLPSANKQQQISPNAIGAVNGCGSVTHW